MKKILCILLTLIIVSACTTKDDNNINTPSGACGISDNNSCEDEEIIDAKKDLKWDAINLKEALDKLDETVVLFLSFKDCPYCVAARPVLEEVMENSEIAIYYVDVLREERVDDNKNYQQLYTYLKSALDEAGYEKVFMPSVLFIKDGKLEAMRVGIVGDEKTMTNEQKEELKLEYISYLDKIN